MSEHKNVFYDLKFRLLYYDAAGNNRYKLKISTYVFDLFIHNVFMATFLLGKQV